MLLQAIQDTKVHMQIWLGVYVDDDDTVWERQKSDTLQALQTYGTDHVAGITVGNEYILGKNATAASYKWIADKVVDFRTSLAALKLSKDIPVG
jgi:exo-beta-1,3-glucanase (GH17 family)